MIHPRRSKWVKQWLISILATIAGTAILIVTLLGIMFIIQYKIGAIVLVGAIALAAILAVATGVKEFLYD